MCTCEEGNVKSYKVCMKNLRYHFPTCYARSGQLTQKLLYLQLDQVTIGMGQTIPVSYTHLTLPTNREV